MAEEEICSLILKRYTGLTIIHAPKAFMKFPTKRLKFVLSQVSAKPRTTH
jgi:hypothetical protein